MYAGWWGLPSDSVKVRSSMVWAFVRVQHFIVFCSYIFIFIEGVGFVRRYLPRRGHCPYRVKLLVEKWACASKSADGCNMLKNHAITLFNDIQGHTAQLNAISCHSMAARYGAGDLLGICDILWSFLSPQYCRTSQSLGWKMFHAVSLGFLQCTRVYIDLGWFGTCRMFKDVRAATMRQKELGRQI